MVQAVERAFAVLESFESEQPALSASDISARTGLARPTVYRLLQTLQRLGYVHNHDGRYEVTPRVLRLGAGYLGHDGFARRAQAVVGALTEQVGEHAAAAVLDNGEVLAIAAAHSPRSRYLSVAVGVGQRLPAVTTSLGRILLAHQYDEQPRADGGHLDENERLAIQADGYAVTDGLLETGLVSIGVPVWNRDRAVIAALSVAANTSRVSAEELTADVLGPLQRAAAELERFD